MSHLKNAILIIAVLLIVACRQDDVGQSATPTTIPAEENPTTSTTEMLATNRVRIEGIEPSIIACYFGSLLEASNGVSSIRGIELDAENLKAWANNNSEIPEDVDKDSITSLVNWMNHTVRAGTEGCQEIESEIVIAIEDLQSGEVDRVILGGCYDQLLELFEEAEIEDVAPTYDYENAPTCAEATKYEIRVYEFADTQKRSSFMQTIDAIIADSTNDNANKPQYSSISITRSVLMGAPWEVIGGPWEVIGGGGSVISDPLKKFEDIRAKCGDKTWIAPYAQWALQMDDGGIGIFNTQGNHQPCTENNNLQAADKLIADGDWLGQGVQVYILDTSPFRDNSLETFKNEWREVGLGADKFVELELSELDLEHSLPNEELVSSYRCNYDKTNFGTEANHGLFIASLVHAIAPEATIKVIRVMNDSAQTTTDTIIAGLKAVQEDLDHVIATEPDYKGAVINMSFSMHDYLQQTTNAGGPLLKYVSGPNDGLDMANLLRPIEDLQESKYQATFVAAAGNLTLPGIRPRDGLQTANYGQEFPARFSEVLGVGSSNSGGEQSCFSNYHAPNQLRTIFAPSGDGYDGRAKPSLQSVNVGRNLCQPVPNTFTCDSPFEVQESSLEDTDTTERSLLCAGNMQESGKYNCTHAITSVIKNANDEPNLAYGVGTSYSSGLVSGLAALVRQVCPDSSTDDITYFLTGEREAVNIDTEAKVIKFDEIRNRLSTAHQDNVCVIDNFPLDNFEDGLPATEQVVSSSEEYHERIFHVDDRPIRSISTRQTLASSSGNVTYVGRNNSIVVTLAPGAHYSWVLKYGHLSCPPNLLGCNGDTPQSAQPLQLAPREPYQYEGVAIRFAYNTNVLHLIPQLRYGDRDFILDNKDIPIKSTSFTILVPFAELYAAGSGELLFEVDLRDIKSLRFGFHGGTPDEIENRFAIEEIFFYKAEPLQE